MNDEFVKFKLYKGMSKYLTENSVILALK